MKCWQVYCFLISGARKEAKQDLGGMMEGLRRNSGFTLIELLIVVAILALLAAIAIPFFSNYYARSQNAAAMSDLKNFKAQMEAAYSDVQHYP